MLKGKTLIYSFALIALLNSCMKGDKGQTSGTGTVSNTASNAENSALKEQIKSIIKDDPSIILDALKSKPREFVETIQEAARVAQEDMIKNREKEEKEKFEKSFENPLTPNIPDSETIRGSKNGPIVLVEYADFQCPYCGRAYEIVNELMKKYEGKVKFVYKHLPLDFHDQAQLAAQYFEAISNQSADKAWSFHDDLLKNVPAISKGKAFFDSVAKKVGCDMGKLAKDVESKEVIERVKADKDEATKFEFHGTPAFILNGIPLSGAQPLEKFVSIIDELVKRGKLSL